MFLTRPSGFGKDACPPVTGGSSALGRSSASVEAISASKVLPVRGRWYGLSCQFISEEVGPLFSRPEWFSPVARDFDSQEVSERGGHDASAEGGILRLAGGLTTALQSQESTWARRCRVGTVKGDLDWLGRDSTAGERTIKPSLETHSIDNLWPTLA